MARNAHNPQPEPLYPVMLHVQDRLAVVVGGGAVGRRKVEGLLQAGARIRVVDPNGSDWPEGVERLAESYQPRHLGGAELVFACTDSPALNAQVAEDARALNAWVSRADNPADSDFTLPAVHRGPGVVLAVATTGGAPTAAAALRDALAQAMPAGAQEFALALAQLRAELKERMPNARKRAALLRRLGGAKGLARFQQGGLEALRDWAEQEMATGR